MTSSGSYGYSPSNSSLLIWAFNRCRVRPTALTRDHLIAGIHALNMLLVSWANRGCNLWVVKPFTIQIVAGTPTYTAGSGVTNISPYATAMLDVYYSQINAGGAGINTDNIMLPIGRTDYDQYANKLAQGQPSVYWFEKLPSPQITLYLNPQFGYPTVQVAGHYLSLIQKANLGGAETPDVPFLAYAALQAELADELAIDWCDDAKLRAEIKLRATERWIEFSDTNREDAPVTILPAMDAINGWLGND